MKKNIILLTLLATINVASVFAEDNASGHVATIYGGLLHDAFGGCVHTVFYNPDTDALPECGEVPPPCNQSVGQPIAAPKNKKKIYGL